MLICSPGSSSVCMPPEARIKKISKAASLTPGATSYRGPGSRSNASGKNDSIHDRDSRILKRKVIARHTVVCTWWCQHLMVKAAQTISTL
eukprot:2864474-Pleurochrysis_carterae.AAC.1